MTDTLKSVLFIDFDSLYLGLRARDPALGRRFAARPGLLLDAIERGALIASPTLGAVRRRVLMRRCYADPRLIGRARDAFVSQGYQIVDCPTLPGRERNAAEVQITLDVIDALAHPTSFDEFILLGAESDFTPLIYRLRAHNRATTIYGAPATAGAYRAIADGLVEQTKLFEILAAVDDAEIDAEDARDEERTGRTGATREDLATLARRIHVATNVPLFAPRAYADLFRALTAEIAVNGYQFESTAENVAARLIAAGRKASRRQIAFVVKGLALKGHILSQSDTPERLAEVFREQVLYLARHAGIEVDARGERLVQAWIVGGGSPVEPESAAEPAFPAPAEPAATLPAPAMLAAAPLITPPPREPKLLTEPTPYEPVAPAAMETPQEKAAEPEPTVEPAALPTEEPIDTVPPSEPPDAPSTAVIAVETVDVIEVDRLAPDEGSPADDESLADLASVLASSPYRHDEPEDLAALADSPDPADETEAGDAAVPEVVVTPPPGRVAPAVRPPIARPAPPRGTKPAEPVEPDPFENALLAAVAEAVQARNSKSEPGLDAAPEVELPSEAESPAQTRSAAEVQAEADIGDEIQRILAAYNIGRKPTGG